MAKKPLLGDKERRVIALVYNTNPKEKAEAIRQMASKRLVRELGLSTVQRELAKLRKRFPQGCDNPIDQEWSMGSLLQYPVDPSVIPFLLYIHKSFKANIPKALLEFEKLHNLPVLKFTIREALWISRLFHVPLGKAKTKKNEMVWIPSVSEIGFFNDEDNPSIWEKHIKLIVNIAMDYNATEMACELCGITPIKTLEVDAPTLIMMANNIHNRDKVALEHRGIFTGNEPNAVDAIVDLQTEELRLGGYPNARSHRKAK